MAIVINGSGTVTGISVGGLPDDIVDAGTLADNAVGLAQMAGGTDGNIITYDTSGNPAVVATGSDGQVLTSAGADAVPAFEAAAAGGQLLQVKQVVFTTNLSTSSATFEALTETLDITPASTSSKIYAFCNIHVYIEGHTADTWSAANIQLFRDTTRVDYSDGNMPSNAYSFGRYTTSDVDRMMSYVSKNFKDSPSSTSTLTYSVKMAQVYAGQTLNINNYGNGNMILMEVAE